jgi:hypothetical protein
MSENEGRPDDERLVQRAKALFDESVQALDAGTLSKLHRARRQALAGAGEKRAPWTAWMPAGAVTAGAVAAIAAVAWHARGTGELPGTAEIDAEILLAGEELEMLEDLEFYRWLALVEAGEEPGAGGEAG